MMQSDDKFASRLRVSLVAVIGVLLVGLGAGLNGAAAQTPAATIENQSEDVRLQLNYNGSLLVPGTFDPPSPADSIPTTGAGTRMMWYPAKAAFRAGRLINDPDAWDPANVGHSSVAFGRDPIAAGEGTVALGENPEATGESAVALGFNAEASGRQSLAIGRNSGAFGDNSTAIGFASSSGQLASVALGFNTLADGRAATAMGEGTEALGRASTAMGENTAAVSDHSLTIGLNNKSNTDAGDSEFLFVAGNGTGDAEADESDALVLDKDGNLTIEGTFTDELGTFAGHFEGQKNDDIGPDGHIALIKNNSSGSSADGLAVQTGSLLPSRDNNFLTFYDGDENALGSINGNSSGGVNYESGGADFAEELPVAETAAVPEPKDLVGVRGGTVRLETERADRVMIVSSGAAVTGNVTPESEDGDARRAPVAFVGQVPVRLRGTADVGDLVVASGEHDGTARAVAPSAYRRADHGPIAGQVWTAKTTEDIGPVTVAVGIGSAGRTAVERLHEQQKQIDDLQKRVQNLEDLEQRLASVEAKASDGSMMAGLSGSGLLAVVLLALGTGLGAGVFWRRR